MRREKGWGVGKDWRGEGGVVGGVRDRGRV